MSKWLKPIGVTYRRLEAQWRRKKKQGRKFEEKWRVHIRICKESRKIRKCNDEKGGQTEKARFIIDNDKQDPF